MSSLENSLIAFCNPLLDISANVELDFLKKYGLDANNAILAEERHLPLYEELVSKHQVLYTAGGGAQNAMRAAQWLLPSGSTVYVGCVGDDKFGSMLRQVAEADGLRAEYMVDTSGASTGTCAVLISTDADGHHRSLVANLGAANNYKIEHIMQPHMQKVLAQSKCIYISGYFLTVSPSTVMMVAGAAREASQVVCLNLSAPFITQFFQEPLLQLLPHVDFLFGNETEFRELAKGIMPSPQEDIPTIAQFVAAMPKTTSRPRQVIVTQGCQPTIAIENGKLTQYPVTPISEAEIVDTNGAGDAFCGGFLSQLVQGKSMASCIAAGHHVAGVIVRTSGFVLPSIKPQLEF